MLVGSGFGWSPARCTFGVVQKESGIPSLLSLNPDYRPVTSTAPLPPRVEENIVSAPPIDTEGAAAELNIKQLKFNRLLRSPTVDLDQLRSLAWSGIPADLRAETWKLLCVRSEYSPQYS